MYFQFLKNIWNDFINWLTNLLVYSKIRPVPSLPISKNVLVISHIPILKSKNNATLFDYFGWNNPFDLVDEFIKTIKDCSYQIANYHVVEHIVVNDFPLKIDGFKYTEESYLEAKQTNTFHSPDAVDYMSIIKEFDIIGRVERGEIDTVWIMAMPYAGLNESIIIGKNAYYCNGTPIEIESIKPITIIGWNYERGLGEMLHSYCHAVEFIMNYVYRKTKFEDNLWWKFILHEHLFPGHSEVGTVHFPPNAEKDYSYGDLNKVMSKADNWLKFPNLSGKERLINCEAWGGSMLEHHKWWLRHIPHVEGESNGIKWNWWYYILSPEKAI